ncbi:hypothetical protein DH2020_046755 [Rehmannia glutinosa]|uniref:Uncharacterized protein n=1 Tax=Rehmannia glutinosa TaxID=99300 RepID=A0ABR0UBB6_REHGL
MTTLCQARQRTAALCLTRTEELFDHPRVGACKLVVVRVVVFLVVLIEVLVVVIEVAPEAGRPLVVLAPVSLLRWSVFIVMNMGTLSIIVRNLLLRTREVLLPHLLIWSPFRLRSMLDLLRL